MLLLWSMPPGVARRAVAWCCATLGSNAVAVAIACVAFSAMQALQVLPLLFIVGERASERALPRNMSEPRVVIAFTNAVARWWRRSTPLSTHRARLVAVEASNPDATRISTACSLLARRKPSHRRAGARRRRRWRVARRLSRRLVSALGQQLPPRLHCHLPDPLRDPAGHDLTHQLQDHRRAARGARRTRRARLAPRASRAPAGVLRQPALLLEPANPYRTTTAAARRTDSSLLLSIKSAPLSPLHTETRNAGLDGGGGAGARAPSVQVLKLQGSSLDHFCVPLVLLSGEASTSSSHHHHRQQYHQV